MINNHSRLMSLIRPLLALQVTLLACLILVAPVQAATIEVTTNNTELDGGTCVDRDYSGGTGVSIAEAICIANNNGTATDTITIPLGINITTVTRSIPPVTDTVIINGNGPDTTIQGSASPGAASWRIFVVDPGGNLTLTDMTLRNGRCNGSCEFAGTQNGGAIVNEGELTVDRCIFSGNISSDSNGGVIANEQQGIATVTNSTFLSNMAVGSGGGGAIFNDGTLTLSTNTFYSNSTGNGDGGAILNDGTANLTNNTLSENGSSGGDGGGVYNSGTLHITNTIIADSPAGGDCHNSGGGTIGTN